MEVTENEQASQQHARTAYLGSNKVVHRLRRLPQSLKETVKMQPRLSLQCVCCCVVVCSVGVSYLEAHGSHNVHVVEEAPRFVSWIGAIQFQHQVAQRQSFLILPCVVLVTPHGLGVAPFVTPLAR